LIVVAEKAKHSFLLYSKMNHLQDASILPADKMAAASNVGGSSRMTNASSRPPSKKSTLASRSKIMSLFLGTVVVVCFGIWTLRTEMIELGSFKNNGLLRSALDTTSLVACSNATATTATNTPRRRRDADGCYHVFIDAGANIGVHGRFLFEPEKYEKARRARRIFNQEFTDKRDNRDFCVFAIEPNPVHRETLLNKTKAYAALGWRYHVMNVGASDRNGTMEFWHQQDPEDEEWGFGVKDITDKVRKTQRAGVHGVAESVPIIRFATWLEEHVNQRVIPDKPYGYYGEMGAKVVAKLDIEGSEYVVFPDLLLTGAICGIDLLFGEFHARFAPFEFEGQRISVKTEEEAKAIQDAWLKTVPSSRNCKTRFLGADDESYLHDGVPLPAPDKTETSKSE
jgi:hypothetical protein